MSRLYGWLRHPLRPAVVACAAFGVACGGAPSAPQAPASSASRLASAPLAAEPDLGPVEPPVGLVVSGRVARLEASLTTVHGWTQLPMPGSDQVTELLSSQPLGAIVDLAQPIDFAVTLEGAAMAIHTSIAVAAGVRDLEEAKSKLAGRYKLIPVEGGALSIQPDRSRTEAQKGKDEEPASDDDDSPHVCELAPAYGAARTRLVCASNAKALSTLVPWMTRGATRQTSTADAHIELYAAPIKPLAVSEKHLLSVLFGTVVAGHLGLPSARDVGQAVGGDLADFATDLDTIALDVTLSDPGAAATATVRFSGTSSTLARLAAANADRNGAPPPAFWQMPGDTSLAVFDRGVDANVFARVRDLALKLVDDKMAQDGLKDADRHAITDALAKLSSTAPSVYAGGTDADAALKAFNTAKGLVDSTDADAQREANRVAMQTALGWQVVEVDEPAAPIIDAMKALVAAFARPSVTAAFRAKGASYSKFVAARMPKDGSWPKDSAAFELDLAPPEGSVSAASKGKAKGSAPKPIVVDLFIVPDGQRSWIGFGEAALTGTKLSLALSGAGDNLRSRSELAYMKDASVGAAGFMTLRGLPESVDKLTILSSPDHSVRGRDPDLFEVASQLPHLGMTPIPFSLTAQAGAPTTFVVTLQVPRATIEDVLVLALKYGW